MNLFFTHNLRKILFVVCFLFLTPFAAQANDCTENGGYCGVAADTSCSLLAGGSHDAICGTGKVCCVSTAIPATDYQEGSTGGFLFLKGHLVPCGRLTDDPGTTTNTETAKCTLCHLFLLLKNIFDLMLSLIIVVSILLITVGGVIYIVSAGSPKLTGMAKDIVTKTLFGFGLMLVGWILVFTLLSFLSAGDMVGSSGTWYNFTCDIDSSFSGTATPATALDAVDDTAYSYQDGINTDDASDALNNFLACMEPKLATAAKSISSISDSAGIANCIPTTWTDAGCAHAKNSCHYGGTACVGESYAVDFGNEAYYSQIYAAAKDCDSNAYVLNEGNHVHVSIGSSHGCGCN